MSRVYFIRDARGERRLGARDFPLHIGGTEQGGIVLPGLPAAAVVAHIGLDDGHAFIQPAETEVQLFHNHEHLGASQWLKSGDVVEVGDAAIHWIVQGDQVNISVQPRAAAEVLVPPAGPPPVTRRALPEVVPQPRAPARSQRTLRRVVTGVFVLLLLAVAFVLLATPVAVRITPEPERYSLAGFPPAVFFGGRQLVLPGRYTVTAQRAGYRALEQVIDVASGGFQLFELQLEELPGRVTITLQPDVPFRLFVNDAAVATDAGNLAGIPGGTHRLRIETDRYLPVEETLAVAGKGAAQQVTHVLQPAWANVHIDSRPAGATVQVDGVPVGTTPLKTELVQGERSLVLTLDKHKELALPLQVLAGADQVLEPLQLQPADGRLVLGSDPAGASVSVDGVFQGTTPVTLTLASGVEHTLRLTRPGYRRFDKKLQLAADEEQAFAAQLRPQYGIVFVSAQPADATLQVDGRDAGKATQRLQLTTRSHTLVFSKPGYVSQTVTVTPRAGTSRNVDVTLLTAAQAKITQQAAATPAVITRSRRTAAAAGACAGQFTHGGIPARGRTSRQRECAPGAAGAPRLPGEPRGDQRRVPAVRSGTQFGVSRRHESEYRQPAGGECQLGCGGPLLQLAERPRGTAAGVYREQRPYAAGVTTGDRLPVAERGGVGLRGAQAREPVRAALPVAGRFPARGRCRQFCRRQYRRHPRQHRSGLQ